MYGHDLQEGFLDFEEVIYSDVLHSHLADSDLRGQKVKCRIATRPREAHDCAVGHDEQFV